MVLEQRLLRQVWITGIKGRKWVLDCLFHPFSPCFIALRSVRRVTERGLLMNSTCSSPQTHIAVVPALPEMGTGP